MDGLNDAILAWYDANKREIPFRKTKNPYHIWVSEIMCQQTRIETVIPYFNRFIKEIPTIYDLANYPDDDLYKLWQGLGYYNRVKNMKKAAIEMVTNFNGEFPKSYDEAIKLKGIGTYTAGAILSISYDLPYSAVDGNVLRVFTRLFADESDISLDTTKKKYKKIIEDSIPSRSGDYNQAIMDIGATICPPNESPKCNLCPISKYCRAYLSNKVLDYPVNNKKIVKEIEEKTVLLIYVGGKLVLHKRSEKGLLSGLYEFVNLEGHKSVHEIQKRFKNSLISVNRLEDKSFTFTHKKWMMVGYEIRLKEYELKENEVFATMEDLKQKYSIPKAFNQFL